MRWSRALCGLAVLLLFVLAWTGISGGVGQLDETRTPGQEIQTILQFDYGVLSLVAIGARFSVRRYQWRLAIWVVWAFSLAFAGGLAPVVWGDASVGIGFLAGLATLLVASGIVWLLSRG